MWSQKFNSYSTLLSKGSIVGLPSRNKQDNTQSLQSISQLIWPANCPCISYLAMNLLCLKINLHILACLDLIISKTSKQSSTISRSQISLSKFTMILNVFCYICYFHLTLEIHFMIVKSMLGLWAINTSKHRFGSYGGEKVLFPRASAILAVSVHSS